jgi:hypothetical protein
MPQHLSILFRARPPLDYRESKPYTKYKPLTGLFDINRDFLSLFEDGDPPKKELVEKPSEK